MKRVSIPGLGSFTLPSNGSSRLEDDGTAVMVDHGNRKVSSIVGGVYQLAETPSRFETIDEAVVRFLRGVKTAQLPASIEHVESEKECCSIVQAVSPRNDGGVWIVRAFKCSVMHVKADILLLSVNGEVEAIMETAFPILHSVSPHL